MVEERVNTEKVVAETSNKKGKMKMTEISKTKKEKSGRKRKENEFENRKSIRGK